MCFSSSFMLSIWTAVLDLTQDFWKSSVDPHQPIMLSTNSHTKQLSSGGADAEQAIPEKGGMQLTAHRAEHKISYQAAAFESGGFHTGKFAESWHATRD